MNIALLAWAGHNNMGDSLMAEHLSRIVGLGKHHVRLYSDRVGDGAVNGMEDKSYLSCDVIVVGGGGIVSPGFWAFKHNGLQALLQADKPIAFINVNVTPENLQDADFTASLRALEAAWWVRDQESVELLAGVGIEAEMLADVSFRTDVAGESLTERSEGKPRNLAVFANHYTVQGLWSSDVRAYTAAMQGVRTLAHHLDWMAYWGWQITFVPASTARLVDDRLAAAAIYSLMQRKDRATWIAESVPWQAQAQAIASSDMVLSMRFHSTTLALASGTPIVDIAHHAKSRRLLEATGQQAVEFQGLTHEALIASTERASTAIQSPTLAAYRSNAQARWDKFEGDWSELLDYQFPSPSKA